MLDNLNKYNVMLASKSPRRRELLAMLDVPFSIASPVDVDEVYPHSLSPAMIPEYLANIKSEAYKSILHDNALIITADTVVLLGDNVLGKPSDAAQATEMLLHMSGRRHRVVTGVCVATAARRESFSVESSVKFAQITEAEAHYYVEHYSPLDKAGAYGIQEWIGAVAVESIEGSFYNVMGLPVHQLYRRLLTF